MLALIIALAAVIAAALAVTVTAGRRSLYRHNREEGTAVPRPTSRPILAAWRERLANLSRGRHGHDWHYRPRTIGGWGIAECQTCGATDLY